MYIKRFIWWTACFPLLKKSGKVLPPLYIIIMGNKNEKSWLLSCSILCQCCWGALQLWSGSRPHVWELNITTATAETPSSKSQTVEWVTEWAIWATLRLDSAIDYMSEGLHLEIWPSPIKIPHTMWTKRAHRRVSSCKMEHGGILRYLTGLMLHFVSKES